MEKKHTRYHLRKKKKIVSYPILYLSLLILRARASTGTYQIQNLRTPFGTVDHRSMGANKEIILTEQSGCSDFPCIVIERVSKAAVSTSAAGAAFVKFGGFGVVVCCLFLVCRYCCLFLVCLYCCCFLKI